MMKEKNTAQYEISENDERVLALYLREINNIPLLSYEEEYELTLKAKEGNKVAREKIINSNLRFVVSVAKKYRGQGLPLSDLINEGNIGLIVALDKFEPEKGYHFISYAVWWIRQSIMKAISDKGRAIRLPLNRSNELMQIQKAERKLMEENETSLPTSKEIAELTGLDEELVNDLLNVTSEMVSFDSPVKKGEESESVFGDFMEDEKEKGPEGELIESSMKKDVRALLEVLTEKEREIITLRYGLDGEEALSLKEIGEKYNLTKERIRQIEKKALEKMREEGEKRSVDSYSIAV